MITQSLRKKKSVMINMLMILKDTNLNKKNAKVISILKSVILLEKPNNLIGSMSLGKI